MTCSDAGPLGAQVVHPGPIVSYTWGEFVFPPWLIERVRVEDLDPYGHLARAMLQSIRDTAVPHRWDFGVREDLT